MSGQGEGRVEGVNDQDSREGEKKEGGRVWA